MTEPGQKAPIGGGTVTLLGPPETIAERLCAKVCATAIVAMVVLTCAEVASRTFIGRSLGFADEIGGYLLAAITFLSLPVALVHGALHSVDFVQRALSPFWRLITQIVFLLLALGFACVMEWQLIRLVMRSYSDHVLAPTILGTPVWLPQSAMAVGMGLLALALARAFFLRISDLLMFNLNRFEHARMD